MTLCSGWALLPPLEAHLGAGQRQPCPVASLLYAMQMYSLWIHCSSGILIPLNPQLTARRTCCSEAEESQMTREAYCSPYM